jgi:UrcA family protein
MRKDADRLSLALVAAALAMASGAAVAQQTPSSMEIVVEAPRVERTAERGSSGAPIDIISVTHRVSYKDIDISTSSGAKVLETRIDTAAKAACKEIDTLYPLRTPAPNSPPCEKTAFDRAMVQARAAIAAAEKTRK